MIFAEPVSDMIAPGYSSIISSPMDLSTMQVPVSSCVFLLLIRSSPYNYNFFMFYVDYGYNHRLFK